MYISETNIVEKSIHNKFDDKKLDNQISKLVGSFADIKIYAKT